ncbi:MAG TPA: G/U mismatch-specific DNA glycosylase [Gemmatimonas aurantiaca]|uniref:G/U mismatch-specific DNA glycosylase n=2 Tax=Gemmatimonas aurantiaca TaxID=173480 RepID=C1AEM5_GEMAT|nr:G/U mismatch-specific DNA glycosylase [Gemmatimonas aurantiaca]BAH40952.1 G/U mismatch-specific DNA glycosylase [Gemmatimonas aurantiaca T-27]HCT58951.1 G/U mismatch-specific DNA glycosylase [Gemmatimonas aurantiaca]
MTTPSRKPTKAELAAAVTKTVPDLLAPDLRVLFCGINPGLYTSAVGHHFARPGNRFWPALHGAGFTPRLFSPWDEHELLPLGYGITNMVERTTAAAAELTAAEYVEGGQRLRRVVAQYRPRVVAFMGIGAYRTAFGRPKATLGLQPDALGDTALWTLPSPSGLNANHQLGDLIALLRELRLWVEASF